MRAASENLVPVTLELGGKSPVIVERGTSIEDTAYRIAHGKLANGGQTCVAPDYALVPEEEVEAFTAAFEQAVDRLYPSVATNPDHTWIINDHHFARLTGLVEDAVAKGARMIEIGARPSGTSGSQSRLFLPKLLLGVTDEMNVMHEEIFGPILPVVTYRELEDAIAYVNGGRDRWRSTSSVPMDLDAGACSTTPPRATSSSTTRYSTTSRTICHSAVWARAAWATITAPKASRP